MSYAIRRTRLHENIRLKVASLILSVTKDVVKDLKRQLGEERSLLVYALNNLEEFLEKSDYWQIIIPQEVAAGKGWVDMDLFGRIIFEIKGSESEFSDAVKKVVEDYLPNYPRALYVVITNYDKWWVLKVSKAKPLTVEEVFYGDLDKARNELRSIIIDVMKREGYKVPPTPKAIALLFSDVSAYEPDLVKMLDSILASEAKSGDKLITPLYESFKHVIKVLYAEADEDFIKRLFAKHTLLQMIVLASVSKVFDKEARDVDLCSGAVLNVEVALPHLNWWYIAYERGLLGSESRKMVERLTGDIVSKVSIIDWDVFYAEDVFREFYELLIDQETRRKIGEYYTPLWVVELIIDKIAELAGGLRGKLVLDPFCGSGTFLVLSFYRKIAEGASPDEALAELIGFDINPLAVSIARAELMIAYRRAGGSGMQTPLIFHTDSFRPVFGGGVSRFIVPRSVAGKGLFAYTGARKTVLEEIFDELSKLFEVEKIERLEGSAKDNLLEIVRFERLLSRALRIATASSECRELPDSDKRLDCLGKLVKSLLAEAIRAEGMGGAFVGRLLKERIMSNLDTIATLLAKLLNYYGNGIWAVTITSMLAPYVTRAVKTDIVVTNPPWLQLTKFEASYAERVRESASELIRRVQKEGIGQVVSGSDLASMALYVGLNMSRQALGYVMPREASFYAGSSMRAGLLLTYAVLKSFEKAIERVEMIDLDFDAFQHGNYPSVVIVKLKQQNSKV